MNTTATRIPAGPVPYDYVMDATSEDLVRGRTLQEGMVVLLEATYSRSNPDELDRADVSAYTRSKVAETSQWCRVTDIEIQGEILSFIGVYWDGSKRERSYNLSYCWFVKTR